MATFALRLLGVPTLVGIEGASVVPSLGAKPMALLTFMALEPRAHTRESLAGLLWGDSPEAEARASLRQALKQLREALGSGLRADRTLVELSTPLDCDVLDFRNAAEREPVRAAEFDVPAHWDGERWSIDCPFPRAFDEEAKTWGEEITWDAVLTRWKARGPMNEAYVEKLQRGYRTTSFRRAG